MGWEAEIVRWSIQARLCFRWSVGGGQESGGVPVWHSQLTGHEECNVGEVVAVMRMRWLCVDEEVEIGRISQLRPGCEVADRRQQQRVGQEVGSDVRH